MRSSVSSRLRFLLNLALLAIVVAMPSAARAQCQASGSIQVNPLSGTTCGNGVLAGGTFDVSYFITNTSSNGTPGPQVAAVLSGTTVATLACDNSSCALQGDPATFVPVGADGCVAKAAGVLNCSAGGVNQAVINMEAGGVALAAGQQIFLATIRVQVGANAVVGCNTRFTRADTGPDDMATNDPACDPAVSGGGQGSSSFKKVECTTGVECRPSTGQCDPAELCNANNTCPADAKSPSTTTCTGTSNGGPCDGTDSCDGAGNCVDGFKPMTTTCRPAVGQCDVAESCSGTSGACPADGFQPSTTACTGNSNGGPCDGTDSCDGAGHCVDGYKPSTTICRQSAGQCDVPESCTGTSSACPSDGFQPSTTTCTGTSNGGPCDGTDSCDGAGHCVDGYKPSTTICRAATGACDVAESCTGSSGSCPADGSQPAGTTCPDTDGDPCTIPACDGHGNCNQTSSTDPRCQKALCRVTGGGVNCRRQGQCCDPVTGACAANTGSNGHSVTCKADRDCAVFGDAYPVCTFCTEDSSSDADTVSVTFGGQVGAPFTTPGCHDNDTCVQGNWTHQRHDQSGSLHSPSFYSMVCSCDEGDGTVQPGVCGNRNNGPTPPAAPANLVCFTGIGTWSATSGRRNRPVAFRVEIEDRGEPGGGQNAGNLLVDVYRMRIWYASNDADALAKVEAACCQNPISSVVSSIGQPDILDGGNLIHGNLQIHKLTGNPNNYHIPDACFLPGAN